MPPRPLHRSKSRHRTLAWMLAGVFGSLPTVDAGGVGTAAGPLRNGPDLMAAAPNSSTSVLVDYYDNLLRDGDVEGFRRNVSARFTTATLGRLLDSTDLKARRASVLSLGLMGEFAACNAQVARGLKDKDPTVRGLAHDALWAIWFRAGSPAQNEELTQISRQIGQGRFTQAIEAANQLIATAPAFAEAYNQRAIAHFSLGRYAASAADCHRVLDLNPYHVGALGGLGQCLMQLDKRSEAVAVFRRSLELQPFNTGLRDLIDSLDPNP